MMMLLKRPRCVAINAHHRRCELEFGHARHEHRATFLVPGVVCGVDRHVHREEVWVDDSPEVRSGRAYGINIWSR